ncbi:hypothetical protein BLNAU_10122 [Blattamonas nauphoetae]|uniref:Uncharacterized protein n=1 Tax=Blattamonas nauphoetae TaxID=2049346 RepID=A0ABQ9XU24_9EUKA|nr:hypothetical protein BLNAU_10122 [Blattamonas nauphoetae]
MISFLILSILSLLHSQTVTSAKLTFDAHYLTTQLSFEISGLADTVTPTTLYYHAKSVTTETTVKLSPNGRNTYLTETLHTKLLKPQWRLDTIYELAGIIDAEDNKIPFTEVYTVRATKTPTLESMSIDSSFQYLKPDGVTESKKLVEHQVLKIRGSGFTLNNHTLVFVELGDKPNIKRNVTVKFEKPTGGDFLLIPVKDKNDDGIGLKRKKSYQLIDFVEEKEGPTDFTRQLKVEVRDLPAVTSMAFLGWLIPLIVVILAVVIVGVVLLFICVIRPKMAKKGEDPAIKTPLLAAKTEQQPYAATTQNSQPSEYQSGEVPASEPAAVPTQESQPSGYQSSEGPSSEEAAPVENPIAQAEQADNIEQTTEEPEQSEVEKKMEEEKKIEAEAEQEQPAVEETAQPEPETAESTEAPTQESNDAQSGES